MTAILKFERITTQIAFFLAIVFLCIAASFALYQVLTRFVLDNPSTWSETVIRSTMIWAVFLGVSAAYRDGAMISVEIIQTQLPKRLGLSLYILANFLSLLFFVILFWQGYQMTLRVIPQELDGLPISIAWAYAALPAGTLFTLIAIVGCILRVLQAGQLPSAPIEPKS